MKDLGGISIISYEERIVANKCKKISDHQRYVGRKSNITSDLSLLSTLNEKKNSYKVCDPTLFELPGLHMDINMFTGTRADIFLGSLQNAFLGPALQW